MTEPLTERGVELGGLVVDPALQTGLTVILSRPEDRAILTFPGAIAELRCAMVDGALLARARHVHVAAFFLQRALLDGLGELLASVKARGGTTSLDPNWDPSGEWDGGLVDLLPFVDVLLPNAAEVCAIVGVGEAVDGARRLAEAGPLVVVKLGPQGAVAARAGREEVRVPAPDGQGVVDAVGAGDSFDAGFLAGWLEGWDLSRARAGRCRCVPRGDRGAADACRSGSDHFRPQRPIFPTFRTIPRQRRWYPLTAPR